MNPPNNWQETLDKMILWLKEDKPFCYLRFGDGEFNAMFNADPEKVNGHGDRYFPDMGEALFNVLNEISHLEKQPENLLVGGFWSKHWGIDQEQKLKDWGFLDKIRWCSVRCLIDGIESLKTLEFLQVLKESKREKLFLGNEKIIGAGDFMGAYSLIIPGKDCWLEKDSIRSAIQLMGKESIIIYCMGMASEPIMWEQWKNNPNSIQIDMGHFFDGAFGLKSRAWLQEDNPRLKIYNEKYVPVIRRYNGIH